MTNDQNKQQVSSKAGSYTSTGFVPSKTLKPSTVSQRCFYCGGMKHGLFGKCPAKK